MSDSIVTEQDGGVLLIRLNRPDVYNSFDEEMGAALLEAIEQASDPAVRSVAITGTGKAFCAGEDLRALSDHYEKGEAPDLGDILRRRYIPAVEGIMALEKPVVAGINGAAAGAGVSLALACDYRVMAEEASLVLAFVNAGLIPDAGATWLLPKYLGVGRALALAMTGDKVPAAMAREWGLVNETVPAAELATALGDVAQTFATGPTLAYAEMKRLIWRASGGYLSKHLEEEAAAQTRSGRTEDHLEGVRAFLQKREARFEGR